ncbi:MAG: MarR family transcriptional regulator [Erysipelotrichia bacterium]|nr:MarR family transcriptional regulator [Erysipelotrichia bacterium]NCC54907.1 MarR family transcriptional regulator [Erysipelotrichia bacterium]
MDAKKLAIQLREMMYFFGKNQVLKPKRVPCIKHHDMMFLTAIARLEKQQDGFVKMSDISNFFKISPPATSQAIRKFEKANYVERVRLDHDRRSVYITLTSKVKQEMAEAEAQLNENLVSLIHYLGEEDAKELIRIMQKASHFRVHEEK